MISNIELVMLFANHFAVKDQFKSSIIGSKLALKSLIRTVVLNLFPVAEPLKYYEHLAKVKCSRIPLTLNPVKKNGGTQVEKALL